MMHDIVKPVEECIILVRLPPIELKVVNHGWETFIGVIQLVDSLSDFEWEFSQ